MSVVRYFRHGSRSRAAALLLLAVSVACADPLVPPTPPAVASVQVAPDTVDLLIGGTRQLNAILRAADGQVLAGRTLTWTSSDSTVARIDGASTVTALREGVVTITATSEGKNGRAHITIRPDTSVGPLDHVVLNAQSVTLEEGDRFQFNAVPRDASQRPIGGLSIQWASSDESIAQVSPAGQVMGVRAGTVTITATAQSKQGSATVTVLANYTHDLAFFGFVGGTKGIYRLDIRELGLVPVRLLPGIQGITDVVRPSPDGTRYALVREVGDAVGIYVVNRDGTGLRPLIADTVGAFDSPTWSPDGSRIAFTNRRDGAQSSIWVVNTNGEPNPVNLTGDRSHGRQHSPVWSPRLPDGSFRIAFVEWEHVDWQHGLPVQSIWTMRPDGSGKRQITAAAMASDAQPAWSPDGRTIAFNRQRYPRFIGDFGQIWVVDAKGGNERELLQQPLAGSQQAPVWSPDGKLIAIASNHEGSSVHGWQIYTVWVDGTNLVRRTFGNMSGNTPAWIPRP